MSRTPLISLDRVARKFDDGAVTALHEVSLSVYPGDNVAIVGASGSGKSTLIQLMCGMDAPSAGTVSWMGQAVANRKHWTQLRATEIGVIFQDFLLLPNLSAVHNVEIAISSSGRSAATPRQTALAALDRVGLSKRAHHLPHALSGGERQRVAIARGLVNAPRLMLVDEPTGSLDSRNAELVNRLLIDLQSFYGHAQVLVTHDPRLASRCTKQIRLSDGRILETTL